MAEETKEGYSYGKAPDTVGPEAAWLNGNSDNNKEWSVEDQQKLENTLSGNGVDARVIISTGKYVKVDFFKDNKPFGSYKSRQYTLKEAKKYLAGLLQSDN